MQRITISLEHGLAGEFDRLLEARGYHNRSEAVRDLIRRELAESELEASPAEPCVGALTYVFNHHQRQLAARLTEAQHGHHDLALATVHVHLDHEHCMETALLRGPTAQVQRFAQAVIAEPGVRHGRLHLVPVQAHSAEHSHGEAPPGGHWHYRPVG